MEWNNFLFYFPEIAKKIERLFDMSDDFVNSNMAKIMREPFDVKVITINYKFLFHNGIRKLLNCNILVGVCVYETKTTKPCVMVHAMRCTHLLCIDTPGLVYSTFDLSFFSQDFLAYSDVEKLERYSIFLINATWRHWPISHILNLTINLLVIQRKLQNILSRDSCLIFDRVLLESFSLDWTFLFVGL